MLVLHDPLQHVERRDLLSLFKMLHGTAHLVLERCDVLWFFPCLIRRHLWFLWDGGLRSGYPPILKGL